MIDFGKILKRAWHILWYYKVLWIFGILLAITAGRGGGSNTGYQFSGNDQHNWENRFNPNRQLPQEWSKLTDWFNQEVVPLFDHPDQNITTWIWIGVAGDAATPVEAVATVPAIGAPPNRTENNPDGSSDTIKFGSNSFPAPNSMVFDSQGGLYVSDSFQGAIYRIANAANCNGACAPDVIVHDPLLATAGFPPFGANGQALSGDGKTLFVANTGDDRVLKVDLEMKKVSPFAESINGADGIAFDDDGRLWVAANQNDEVVALNDKGRVVRRLREFRGLDRQGAPRGLLYPASLVIVDDWMYVTNLALPLTDDRTGDEPEEDVKLWTVSKIRLPKR